MNQVTNCNLVSIPYETILHAIKETNSDPFDMVIRSQDEWQVIAHCVNQGIDSYLEGITNSKFDSSTGECYVSSHDLCILLRRLGEIDFEEDTEEKQDCDLWDTAMSLQSAILSVLGIDDYGKYVGREAMGLE